MGLPDELYSVLLEVGYSATRLKIPGLLAHTMKDLAQKSLELWRRDERAAMRFSAMVLAGSPNLPMATGQLSEPVASAYWRWIRLAEYMASLFGSKPSLWRLMNWTMPSARFTMHLEGSMVFPRSI